MEVKREVPLAAFTSWLVGGAAEYYIAPVNTEEVIAAIKWAKHESMPITILGGGTNVLISDKGVSGVLLHLRFLDSISEVVEQNRLIVTALAGTAKAKLLKIFLKHKLAPSLFLAGLPGDVGGGIAMNAGIGEMLTPREFVEITDWIEVVSLDDAQVRRIQKHELQWSYRHCHGWQPGVITNIGLSWPKIPELDIIERVKTANKNRLQKQPLEWPSCGSVFRNPDGDKAGRLIESCGLKALTIGGAQVSEKHANFIVNRGNATASDIRSLILKVQDEVFQKARVQLHTEVVFLGRWS